MIASTPVVLLSGPEYDQPSEPTMKFRLIYEGNLRPTGNDPVGGQRNPLAKHKQEIRKAFHLQLKRLWTTDRFLQEAKAIINSKGEFIIAAPHSDSRPLSDMVADQYNEFGYRFVALVREEWSLLCSLRVLFLRRDFPGAGVITAGDIDNRIKTLIDALRRPRNKTELVGHETPGEGEDPFYVLLEDDSQVTHLEVETDSLLWPLTNQEADQSRTHVVITVELRPYYVTTFNLSFS